MRVLLTGASGFLGRHVLQSPAAVGSTILCISRAAIARAHDEVALGPAPFNRISFGRALATARPDIVLHCAGDTHSADPRTCFESNTILAAELLAAVADVSPPPRVIFVGSAAEYGIVPAATQPVAETHSCMPRTNYGIAKYAQTLLGLAAAARGLPVLTVRLFNPVGIGMPDHLALPSFARQLALGQLVLRVGDLSARRDFIDVAEAARLLLGLAALPTWPWPLVNLCSGQAFSLRALLDGLVADSGLDVRVETDPMLVRSGDMPVLVGSTERLVRLGLAPQAPDFEAILPKLLAEQKHRLS
ncbi:MAG: NAD-dependent epimerase/dehydratase family protein, partial [Xanthobacteraceae bacterium]